MGRIRVNLVRYRIIGSARMRHRAVASSATTRIRRVTSTPAHDGRERIFLLDGHSLAYRAFFALPPTLATSTGQVTNAVYGFTSMLIKLLGDEHPDLIAVAFDMGAPTVRLEKYAEYKAGRRETPARLQAAAGADRGGARHAAHPDGPGRGPRGRRRHRHARRARRRARGIDAVIVTADRDFFQLVRPGDPGDVQPPRDLRHRPVRRGRRGGAVRRPAGEVPRLRCAEGRHLGQHPRRPRGGGEDRREAGPGVRLGRGPPGARRRAAREAEGQRARPPPTS